VPSQQLQDQLQTQHSVDTGNSIKNKQNKESSHIIILIIIISAPDIVPTHLGEQIKVPEIDIMRPMIHKPSLVVWFDGYDFKNGN
jgi:hypothetical protein